MFVATISTFLAKLSAAAGTLALGVGVLGAGVLGAGAAHAVPTAGGNEAPDGAYFFSYQGNSCRIDPDGDIGCDLYIPAVTAYIPLISQVVINEYGADPAGGDRNYTPVGAWGPEITGQIYNTWGSCSVLAEGALYCTARGDSFILHGTSLTINRTASDPLDAVGV